MTSSTSRRPWPAAETGATGVTLTGQLGDVMKESAQIALSYLRSHGAELDLPVTELKDRGVHVHVPAGAVPKDGPSAGVTMTTALASLLSGRPVRSDVAMTGEVSLTGRVLPIGGVKQKLLAAHRAGITTVLIPQRNEPDLDDVPAEVLAKLDVHPSATSVRCCGWRSSPPGRSPPGQSLPGRGRSGRRRLSLLRRDVGGRQIPAGAGIGGLGVPWGIRSRSRGWRGVAAGTGPAEAEAAARLRRQGGRRRRARAVLAFGFRRGSPRRCGRAVWPGRAPSGPVAAGRARP